MPLIVLMVFIVLIVPPRTAVFAAQVTGRAELEELFRRVGQHFEIPALLLQAIARQESDWDPLVINIAGRDYHPRNRQEALALIARAEAKKESYDVGLMQINRLWIHRYGLSPELLLSPANNIFLGAFILAREIKRSGLTWKAVGHYHSHSPKRAVDYARRVRRHLLRLLHASS